MTDILDDEPRRLDYQECCGEGLDSNVAEAYEYIDRLKAEVQRLRRQGEE